MAGLLKVFGAVRIHTTTSLRRNQNPLPLPGFDKKNYYNSHRRLLVYDNKLNFIHGLAERLGVARNVTAIAAVEPPSEDKPKSFKQNFSHASLLHMLNSIKRGVRVVTGELTNPEKRAGVTYYRGVETPQLEEEGFKADVLIAMNPNCGVLEKTQRQWVVKSNTEVLWDIFMNRSKLLSPDGEIHLILNNDNPPYDEWGMKDILKKSGYAFHVKIKFPHYAYCKRDFSTNIVIYKKIEVQQVETTKSK